MKIYNYLRFFCSSSFYRSLRFLSYLNNKDKTDVLLYYPQHLSYQSKYPQIFYPLIKSMESNGISCLFIEEPNITNKTNAQKMLLLLILYGF